MLEDTETVSPLVPLMGSLKLPVNTIVYEHSNDDVERGWMPQRK